MTEARCCVPGTVGQRGRDSADSGPRDSQESQDSRQTMRPRVRFLASLAAGASSCLVIALVSTCTAINYNSTSASVPATIRSLDGAEPHEPRVAELSPAEAAARPESLASLLWPEGTQVLRLRGPRGSYSGAGDAHPEVRARHERGLRPRHGRRLPRSSTSSSLACSASPTGTRGRRRWTWAARPLARLQLGGLRIDQVCARAHRGRWRDPAGRTRPTRTGAARAGALSRPGGRARLPSRAPS